MTSGLKRPVNPDPARLLTDITFWPASLPAQLWHANFQKAKSAKPLRMRFTGGREMQDPSECRALNATRNAWVKKRFGQTDVVEGAMPQDAIVYNIGTL